MSEEQMWSPYETIAMNGCSFTEFGEPNREGYPNWLVVQTPDSCLL